MKTRTETMLFAVHGASMFHLLSTESTWGAGGNELPPPDGSVDLVVNPAATTALNGEQTQWK